MTNYVSNIHISKSMSESYVSQLTLTSESHISNIHVRNSHQQIHIWESYQLTHTHIWESYQQHSYQKLTSANLCQQTYVSKLISVNLHQQTYISKLTLDSHISKSTSADSHSIVISVSFHFSSSILIVFCLSIIFIDVIICLHCWILHSILLVL